MATLYVVATPIGNLKDITLRALEVLKSVDLILCEDTRVTQKLLNHFGIRTRTLSYHQHSKLKKVNYIIELLKQGKDLALVCDAGTPGISDPGNKLISSITQASYIKPKCDALKSDRQLIRHNLETVKITPVPGSSAITTAASVSGFPMDKFLFLGFPPRKRKRKKFFKEVVYRILKTLNELKLSYYHCHGNLNTTLQVVVCRELTKKFETVYRGTIEEVIEKIKEDKTKGEFVVIISPK